MQSKKKPPPLHNYNCSKSHYYSKVVPTELLMAFSMSMKGSGNADKTLFKFLIIYLYAPRPSVEQKLHWTFKLYDKVGLCWINILVMLVTQDGSGEIDPEEMEEIFT